MNVQIRLPMGLADFGRIDFREPVVRNHLAGDIEDETAKTIALVRIGVYSPVLPIQVFIYGFAHVHHNTVFIPEPCVLFSVCDVGSGGSDVI